MTRKKIPTKKRNRKCLVCGKTFPIKLFPDGHYHGGHFFGNLNYPVGKGEYKKTGVMRIGRKNHDVVKWTGKEKSVEYWECDACFQEAVNENWLENKIEDLFGKRCPDFDKGCACCDAWSVYDTIRQDNRGEL